MMEISRRRSIRGRIGALVLGSVLAGSGGMARAEEQAGAPIVRPGISYRHIARTVPRPLKIHVVRIDLQHPGLSLGVVAAADPDGEGPAETTLTPPLELARRGAFSVAVNTSPWAMLPDPKTGEKSGYVAGGACDISGWAVTDGRQLSPPQHYCSFWVDRDGAPHLDDVKTPPEGVRLAVTGFGRLVRAFIDKEGATRRERM
jgi:hypothetical protein